MTDKSPHVQEDILTRLDREVLVKELGPLKAAVITNDAKKIAELIRDGADPNETTLNGVTLLHGAAGWDNAEAIEALIQGGADPNAGNPKAFFAGETPLHYAAGQNMVMATKALIQGGADIHALAGNKITPLHCAALYGNADVAAVLLQAGADPDARSGSGRTPLHDAAPRSAETVSLLLEAGAGPNARDSHGRTPLHWTSDAEVIERLIVEGADANAEDVNGRTPLHSTARISEPEEEWMVISALRALLDGGADPSICDAEDNTPNPRLISRALRPARHISYCPNREDYLDDAAYGEALEEFFKGERQTSYGMTEEAKARFFSA